MKKKRILLINLLLLISLALCPITNFADYPTGDLTYSDTISTGKSFKWKVSTLESLGEYYISEMYIDEIQLEQGDTIEVKVMKDPDEAEYGEIWYNIYVNDINVTDPTDIDLGYIGYYSYFFYGMYFISPVDYTNNTGTYSIYEAIYELIADYSETEEDHETNSYGGTTYTYDYIYSLIIALEGDIFSSEMYIYQRILAEGPGTDKYLDLLEVTIESSLNIKTGLLKENKLWLDYEFFERESEVVNEDEKGYFHFLLEQKGSGAPYNWSYSVLGLSFIALVVVLRRRKK